MKTINLPSKKNYMGEDNEFAYILESKLKLDIKLRPYLKWWKKIETILVVTGIMLGLAIIYKNIKP